MAPTAEKMITVKIGAFPGGQIKSFKLPLGATVGDGLKKAKLNGQGDNTLDVRVNGQRTSSLGAPLGTGDQVLVFSQVRGN